MRGDKHLIMLVAIAMILLAFLSLSPDAFAHPMGNFSINHYTKIEVEEQAIALEYIIDMAEIPTFQEMQQSRFVPKPDDPATLASLARQSESLKAGLTLELGGRPLKLDTVSRKVIFPPGAGGLPTMKMGFLYRAVLESPIAASPSSIHYVDGNFPDRAGWKEVIAVGTGTTLANSSVPSHDRSFELTNYPTDLLHSPPQTLEADLVFKAAPAFASDKAGQYRSFATGVKLEANQQATRRSAFTELIKSNRSDVAFLLTAALIAAVLGGFHAFEPGHGKTLVAAYLVGSRGTARHAVLLGSVVTASHTISVYVLGIVTLYASQWIVPERLYPWLGTASGLLVASLGFALFIRRYTSPDSHSDSAHSHDHSDGASPLVYRHTWWGGHVHSDGAHHQSHKHDPGHLHDHGHDHQIAHQHLDSAHPHDPGHSHTDERASAAARITLRSLFALGITGGIVPCPAALVVLLGALAIHRVAFGLFLIVAFSAGLATVLVGFGLAMVYARRFMSRFKTRGLPTERWLPLASSAVITVIGVTITIQSLVTAGVLRVGT